MSLDFAESQYTLEISYQKVIQRLLNCNWAGSVVRRISLCCISWLQMVTMELIKEICSLGFCMFSALPPPFSSQLRID